MLASTPAGGPDIGSESSLPTWEQAWHTALYGPAGFFRTEAPAEHFRTSPHASALFAEALGALAARAGLHTVVDVGAGRGELLRQLHDLDPALSLLGIEVASRPADLPAAIGWSATLPEALDGIVFANEWLDNLPCPVVEVGGDGSVRVVHVDPRDGAEELGAALDDPGMPTGLGEWVATWWPLSADRPGTRAEVGESRDRAWAGVVGRLTRGMAVAVDFGHTTATRPPWGSLRSYRCGREVEVRLDGTRDVTAAVAVDAVAAAVRGRVLSQREALTDLGLSALRPALGLAATNPSQYAARLARSSEAGELMDPAGLGGFSWVISTVAL